MAFGAAFAQALALLITEGTTIANVADNAASSPITNLFVALHTGSATAGNQTTSEATYTSYARVTIARSSSGWTSSAGVFTNDAAVTFPACTGGSNTISHVSIGTLTSGTGVVIVGGSLTASLAVSSGITPQFAISALATTIA